MEWRQWSLIFFISLPLASFHNGRAYDGSLKKRICNAKTYTQHMAGSGPEHYECSVNFMINKILKYTKQHPTYTYVFGGRCPSDVLSPQIYGYGYCRKELSSDECGDCIVGAKDCLFQECTHSFGAQVELQDCGIRYENYNFTD